MRERNWPINTSSNLGVLVSFRPVKSSLVRRLAPVISPSWLKAIMATFWVWRYSCRGWNWIIWWPRWSSTNSRFSTFWAAKFTKARVWYWRTVTSEEASIKPINSPPLSNIGADKHDTLPSLEKKCSGPVTLQGTPLCRANPRALVPRISSLQIDPGMMLLPQFDWLNSLSTMRSRMTPSLSAKANKKLGPAICALRSSSSGRAKRITRSNFSRRCCRSVWDTTHSSGLLTGSRPSRTQRFQLSAIGDGMAP